MSNDLHGDDLLRRKGGGPVMMVINQRARWAKSGASGLKTADW